MNENKFLAATPSGFKSTGLHTCAAQVVEATFKMAPRINEKAPAAETHKADARHAHLFW